MMDGSCSEGDHINGGTVVYNISTTRTLSAAKKRWRLAYYSINFTHNILSTSKVSKTLNCSNPVSEFVAALEIIQESAVDDSQKFSNIGRADLNDLMESKSLDMLINKFDGVKGLAKSLHTTLEDGITSNDIESRKMAFGSNTGKKPFQKGFFHILWETFNEETIIILMILCAALSIRENGAEEGWDEGSKIFAALILVLIVSVGTKFIQERQFHHLLNKSKDIWIKVRRHGGRQKVSISEVVVGDVVNLDIGDQIPAYGLLISGHSLLVDESNMTGDIDRIEVDTNTNPFLFSGSKVVHGHAQMLVISVEVNTSRGRLKSSTSSYSNKQTPLQSSIKELTSSIAKFGISVATLVLVIMLIRHFTGYSKYKNGKLDNKEEFTDTLDKLRTSCTLMASAQDIPLAVNLTLAYCRKKMIGDKVMVRKLSAIETMGSVSVICTGKTGLLTMNQMKVTKFWIGLDRIEDDDSSVDAKVIELYHQGVGLNTTGCVDNSGTTLEYSGSPTEKAILSWAVTDLGMNMEKLKQDFTILHLQTFNSNRKQSGVFVKKKEDDNVLHVHWKGAAEIVLAMCSNYYQKNGVIKSLSLEEKVQHEKIIQGMAACGLRCIALAYKQMHNEDDTTYKNVNEEGFTLLGIVGIKDPCRPGAKEAINACKSAGVEIKMITGDNVFTAKAIATECGILAAGEQVSKYEVIEGEEFRNYTDDERMKKVDGIRVMARSSPSDKLLMVQCLKKRSKLVAIISHDSNDGPALEEADIGFSMGIHGTAVAKESSDIVILDDDFASVVKTLRWGRCAYNNIQKLVQFQVTMNVSALFINFTAAAFATDAPLTVIQLLWVNIIMDTLGALALTTEQPDIDLMHKRPVRRDAPIITNVMWRNILAQSVYQVTLLLIFHFRGRSWFDVNESAKNTIIFNTFVVCQVFNLFNARKLEKKNVFGGLHKNWLFLGIVVVTVFIQVVMVEYLHNFADTEKLTIKQWGICITAGALTWPIGWFVKLIPVLDTPFLIFIQGWI